MVVQDEAALLDLLHRELGAVVVSENPDTETLMASDPEVRPVWPAPSEPMRVARKILKTRTLEGVALIRRWRGDWMEWTGTHWSPMEEEALKKLLYSMLEDATYLDGKKIKPWSPTRNKILNVAEALGAVALLSEAIHPPTWVPSYAGADPKQLVVVSNGILSVSTRELIDHDPQLFNLVSVPFAYDSEAPHPQQWLRFLNELWPDDAESQQALQQWFGYVLSGRTDLHKILLLVGPTRAGKGVIGRILIRLLSRDNVAGPTLASLGQNFGLQPLIGKPLAIISDARLGSGASVIVERLLSISGEDHLTIDRKYKTPWSGQLNTRFMVISNELPRFGDASGAIANRFVLLALRQSWLDNENTKLTDELIEELPGILNWALDGLQSLNDAGAFTEPKTSRDAITALQDLTSPVSAFARDRCVVGPEHQIEKKELWEAWKRWCEDNGRPRPGTTASFGRDLLAAYPMIIRRRPRDADDRIHVYGGIQLSNPQLPDTVTNPDQSGKLPLVRDGQGDHAL